MERDSEGILQFQNGDNQPVKSRSNPLDSRGGIPKETQQAQGAEKHPGYKHGDRTYDPRGRLVREMVTLAGLNQKRTRHMAEAFPHTRTLPRERVRITTRIRTKPEFLGTALSPYEP